MSTRTNDHGRPTEASSQALRELWAMAAQLNEHTPIPGGEWIPIRSVWIDESILPRQLAELDRETVARYAALIDELPPIRVQEGTFRLIGGLHRLSAAYDAPRDHIRALVEPVPDEVVEDEALRDNTAHGLPLTKEQRRRAFDRCYARHHPDTGGTSGDAWAPALIARACGISERFVHDRLYAERRERDQVVQFAPPEAPAERITRLGLDGKRYPVQPPRGTAAQRAKNGHQSTRPSLTTGEHAAPVSRASQGGETALTAAVESTQAAMRLWERLLAAVEGIEERDPEAMLAEATPQQAAEAARLAERMIAYWARVSDAAFKLAAAEVQA